MKGGGRTRLFIRGHQILGLRGEGGHDDLVGGGEVVHDLLGHEVRIFDLHLVPIFELQGLKDIHVRRDQAVVHVGVLGVVRGGGDGLLQSGGGGGGGGGGGHLGCCGQRCGRGRGHRTGCKGLQRHDDMVCA